MLFAACGGSSTPNPQPNPPPNPTISIMSATPNPVVAGKSVAITVSVTHSTIEWPTGCVNGQAPAEPAPDTCYISGSTATYTPPDVEGSYSFTVKTVDTPVATATVNIVVTSVEVEPVDEPMVFVVGNTGNYMGSIPVMSKILWTGTEFTAEPAEQLREGAGMPINRSGNAPYVFSFLNEAAEDSPLRIALTDYDYTIGGAGVSSYWFYDPTDAGWSLKKEYAVIPNGLPLNPSTMANIKYENKPYLVVADAAGVDEAGGAMHLVSMTGNDEYETVVSQAIPNKTIGGEIYQSHAVDTYVDGDRIFALALYYTDGWPPLQENSEVREYKLTGDPANIAFELVGTVEIGKNALNLVPYTSGSGKYFFIPCVGGAQNAGENNGADSSISVIEITPTGMSAERKAYIGGAYPDLLDFHGIAVASDGTAYILTGDYDADWAMSWSLYQTTASDLVTKANAGSTGTISPALLIAGSTHYNAYLWQIGISQGGDDEYLVFGKGSNDYDPFDWVSHDEIHFLKVGRQWNDAPNANNFIISADVLNGAAVEDEGFAISGMEIYTPGGGIVSFQANRRQIPAPIKAMQAGRIATALDGE